MKVKIGPYRRYFGPYQLAKTLAFWTKRKDKFGLPEYPDWVYSFGEWLSYANVRPKPKVGEVFDMFNLKRKPTKLAKFLSWIQRKRVRKIDIRIDPHDTHDLFITLSYIILPALKDYRADTISSPGIDAEDVPTNLRDNTNSDFESDAIYNEEAWEWIVDEMIWAFENVDNDFIKYGDGDIRGEVLEDGSYKIITNYQRDEAEDEARKKDMARRDNGLMLFGKYYRSLWK